MTATLIATVEEASRAARGAACEARACMTWALSLVQRPPRQAAPRRARTRVSACLLRPAPTPVLIGPAGPGARHKRAAPGLIGKTAPKVLALHKTGDRMGPYFDGRERRRGRSATNWTRRGRRRGHDSSYPGGRWGGDAVKFTDSGRRRARSQHPVPSGGADGSRRAGPLSRTPHPGARFRCGRGFQPGWGPALGACPSPSAGSRTSALGAVGPRLHRGMRCTGVGTTCPTWVGSGTASGTTPPNESTLTPMPVT